MPDGQTVEPWKERLAAKRLVDTGIVVIRSGRFEEIGMQSDLPCERVETNPASRTGFWSSERGQSVIELAIVLPLLLFLITGVLDFGRVVHAYTVTVNAAREAALVGAVEQQNDSDIQSIVYDELARGGATNGANVTVSYHSDGSPSRSSITVRVQYHVPFTIRLMGLTGVTVNSQSTMVTLWD